MTTADIMFAQPGNPESFRDHEYDARTILWALLAAIAIHLVVAFLLAAFSGVFSPTVPFEEKPAELTLMDLSPASAGAEEFRFHGNGRIEKGTRTEGQNIRIERQLNWSKRTGCRW